VAFALPPSGWSDGNKDYEDVTLFRKDLGCARVGMWKREGLTNYGMKTIIEVEEVRGLQNVNRTVSGITHLTLSFNVK
jgi:hypothetical protein